MFYQGLKVPVLKGVNNFELAVKVAFVLMKNVGCVDLLRQTLTLFLLQRAESLLIMMANPICKGGGIKLCPSVFDFNN